MKKIIGATAILAAVASLAFGDGGDNPSGIAGAQSSGASGVFIIDRSWATGNPALVGLESRSQNRLSLFPTSIALWNDRVALPFTAASSAKSYVTMLMRESFGIRKGLSPDDVSEKLTDELGDGICFYAGSQSTPVDFAASGFGVNVRTFGEADMKIPGGLFMPFFSATDGLLAGKSLDLSDTRIGAIFASEIGFKLGRHIEVPVIGDILSLNKGAAGVGVKVLYGHYYYSVAASENSALYYDTVSNKYRIDAGFDVVSAEGGYGLGVDLGTVFHNDNHAVSIDVQDIGMILWDGKNVRRGTTKSGELDLNDKEFDFFTAKAKPDGENYVMWLPMALNVGYIYYLDMSARYGNEFGIFLGYLTASLDYNQQLMLGPGKNTYAPRVSARTKLGFLRGYLPVRYGIIGGGLEKLASTAGVGFDGKYRSVDLSYKAVGSPVLLPKKGFELAFSQTSVWGGRGNAKSKRKKAPPAIQIAPAAPVDTVPQSPQAVQEAPVDMLIAPPAIQEAPVDTLIAPPTIQGRTVDTLIAPPAIQERTVDTLIAPPAIQGRTVDTLIAPPAIQGRTVDTLIAPPAIQGGTVDAVPVPPQPEPKTSSPPPPERRE
ncbi:MAG: DUF5723 family protein [Chitinispirillales bacterium]|jgi:hypothetical protein|nr:DUF5723 family protein [Chitinispirillales bacterium]